MKTIDKILVPVDFTPCSDAALHYALLIADACGAEVELLYVWAPGERSGESASLIFADTPEGLALEQRLSAAEIDHRARVSGRLEFGELSSVILSILEREHFDLVMTPHHGHVIGSVGAQGACGAERPVSGSQLVASSRSAPAAA